MQMNFGIKILLATLGIVTIGLGISEAIMGRQMDNTQNSYLRHQANVNISFVVFLSLVLLALFYVLITQ